MFEFHSLEPLFRRESLFVRIRCAEESPPTHHLLVVLQDEEKRALVDIVARITSPGKGILAADESNGTIGKRLIAAGLANDEETRRAYREVRMRA
jgi:hypothetical protein